MDPNQPFHPRHMHVLFVWIWESSVKEQICPKGRLTLIAGKTIFEQSGGKANKHNNSKKYVLEQCTISSTL